MSAACTSAFEIAEALDDADYRLRALWACLSPASPAAAIARRWRGQKILHHARTTDPAEGPIATVCRPALLVLVTKTVRGGTSERMLVAMSPEGRTSSGFNTTSDVGAFVSLRISAAGILRQAMRSVECHVADLAPAITQCRWPMPCFSGPAPSRFSSAI